MLLNDCCGSSYATEPYYALMHAVLVAILLDWWHYRHLNNPEPANKASTWEMRHHNGDMASKKLPAHVPSWHNDLKHLSCACHMGRFEINIALVT